MKQSIAALLVSLALFVSESFGVGFTFVTGQTAIGTASSGTTCDVVLPNNPTAGSIVTVVACFYGGTGGGTTTVADTAGSPTTYTVTTNSPSTYDSNCGHTYLAYRLVIPSGASKTIRVTFTNTITSAVVWAREFSVAGGTASFGAEAEDHQNGTINVPTVTVTGSNALCICGCAAANAVTSVDSPWTGSIDGGTGWAEGYIASRTGDVAVAMGGVQIFSDIAMSFTFTASASGNKAAARYYYQQSSAEKRWRNFLLGEASFALAP